jgi:hypothetical protein
LSQRKTSVWLPAEHEYPIKEALRKHNRLEVSETGVKLKRSTSIMKEAPGMPVPYVVDVEVLLHSPRQT